MQIDRAILFADVEGSVQLFRRLGDVRALALIEDSHRLTTSAIVRRGGKVIKSIGDGLMASFPDMTTACEAAILAQQGMAEIEKAAEANSLRLRIGIHAGPVIETADDCFGDTVNIAARLSAVANGGEIVVSTQIGVGLPAYLTPMLRRLGTVSLKGVGEGVAVSEILWSHDPAVTVLPHDIAKATVAPGRVRLELASSTGQRWRSQFGGGKVSIGRGDTHQFVLTDPRASRDHATIQLTGEQWVLSDHSTNGTFVVFAGEGAMSLRRKELVLHGLGAIGFGFDPAQESAEALRFTVFATKARSSP